jgi:hypothetical protein
MDDDGLCEVQIKDTNQEVSSLWYMRNNNLCASILPKGKRCDMHVHSRFSGYDRTREEGPIRYLENPIPAAAGVKECYNYIYQIYNIAKSRGMDFVTVSDHDSIEGPLILVENHPDDCFVTCEYTVHGGKSKDGRNVGVHIHTPGLEYPLNSDVKLDANQMRELHAELKKLRGRGFKEFDRQCEQMNVRRSLNHPATNFNDAPISAELFEEWCSTFKYLEINNDARLENTVVKIMAEKHGNILYAGTDAHMYNRIGMCYTESIGDVSSPQEFMRAFDEGNIGIGSFSNADTFNEKFGSHVSAFTSDVYSGAWQYIKKEWGWRKLCTVGATVGLPIGLSFLAGPAIGVLPFVLGEGFLFATVPYVISRTQKRLEAENTRRLYHEILENRRNKEIVAGEELGKLEERIQAINEQYGEQKSQLEKTKLIRPPTGWDRFVNRMLGGFKVFRSNYRDKIKKE